MSGRRATCRRARVCRGDCGSVPNAHLSLSRESAVPLLQLHRADHTPWPTRGTPPSPEGGMRRAADKAAPTTRSGACAFGGGRTGRRSRPAAVVGASRSRRFARDDMASRNGATPISRPHRRFGSPVTARSEATKQSRCGDSQRALLLRRRERGESPLQRPQWSASCDGKVGGAHPATRAARRTHRDSDERAQGKRPQRQRRHTSSLPGRSVATHGGVRGYGSGGRRGGGSRKALRRALGDSGRSARLERSEPSSFADLMWRAAPATAPSGPVANAGRRPATAQLPPRKRQHATSDHPTTAALTRRRRSSS